MSISLLPGKRDCEQAQLDQVGREILQVVRRCTTRSINIVMVIDTKEKHDAISSLNQTLRLVSRHGRQTSSVSRTLTAPAEMGTKPGDSLQKCATQLTIGDQK